MLLGERRGEKDSCKCGQCPKFRDVCCQGLSSGFLPASLDYENLSPSSEVEELGLKSFHVGPGSEYIKRIHPACSPSAVCTIITVILREWEAVF